MKYVVVNDKNSPVITEYKHRGTQVTRTHAQRHSRAHVRQASTGRGKQGLSWGEQSVVAGQLSHPLTQPRCQRPLHPHSQNWTTTTVVMFTAKHSHPNRRKSQPILFLALCVSCAVASPFLRSLLITCLYSNRQHTPVTAVAWDFGLWRLQTVQIPLWDR